MKKALVLVLIVAMAGVAFAAGGGEAGKKQIIIGFNNGSTTVDFLRQVEDSMKRAAEKAGVKLIIAQSNFDAEKIMPERRQPDAAGRADDRRLQRQRAGRRQPR